MDDFENELTGAYLRPEDDDEALSGRVMATIARHDARRAMLVSGAGLAGVALCAGVIGASGALSPLTAGVSRAWAAITHDLAAHHPVLQPGMVAAIGLLLLGVAGLRAFLREN